MKLYANVQNAQDARDGQGSNNVGLTPRDLGSKKVSTPDVTINSKINTSSLYSRLITPEEVQTTRVIVQLNNSEDPQVPISTQLNNKINPTMENMSLKGGTRLK